jgi:rubrerythrin
MAELDNTKTKENLAKAFAGESQARNRYTYFANEAKKGGYKQVAVVLEELAGNEMEHGKIWYRLLCGGVIPKTIENLKSAIESEHDEWTAMYQRMAADAREEGFDDIAFLFDKVADIEKEHENNLIEILEKILANDNDDENKKAVWACQNCGFTVDSKEAPTQGCPVCGNLKEGFEYRKTK